MKEFLLALVLNGKKKLWKVRVWEPKFGLIIISHSTQINGSKIKDDIMLLLWAVISKATKLSSSYLSHF